MEMPKVRQCEQNGSVCGSQEPYPEAIAYGAVQCGGCGRTRPHIEYIPASLLSDAEKERDEYHRRLMLATKATVDLCSCGGSGHGDPKACPACKIYHALKGKP